MGTRSHNRAVQQTESRSDDDIPACQSCRRKKARCSREQPCSQCLSFGATCIYDDRRLKPGLRAGVVDSLSRRIETLEKMFLGQKILWMQMWEAVHPGKKPYGVEGTAQGKDGEGRECSREDGNGLHGQQERIKRCLLQVANTHGDPELDARRATTKRRRIAEVSPAVGAHEDKEGAAASVSVSEVIELDIMCPLVEFYFDNPPLDPDSARAPLSYSDTDCRGEEQGRSRPVRSHRRLYPVRTGPPAWR